MMEQECAIGSAAPDDDVEPQIRQFIDRVNGDYARLSGGAYRDLAHRRAVAEDVRRPWVEGGPAMASIEELRVGQRNVRIRIQRSDSDGKQPALIYLHGGGWVVFSLDTHDRLMREYAARSGCAVIGIDYSLAPEHPYPAALEDIVSVIDWLVEEGDAHGIDPTRLAIGGDSAGANLSICTALILRDRGSPRILSGMLLNYGVYDWESYASYDRYGGPSYMLTADEMADFWRAYTTGANREAACYLRPMTSELSGLPDAFLCIAQCDILADENHAMATRLRDAGVQVAVQEYQGATHSFLEAVNISPLAARALEDASRWLAGKIA